MTTKLFVLFMELKNVAVSAPTGSQAKFRGKFYYFSGRIHRDVAQSELCSKNRPKLVHFLKRNSPYEAVLLIFDPQDSCLYRTMNQNPALKNMLYNQIIHYQ